MTALAKEDGNDEDMAEMIAYEIESLSSELKQLEEKLTVFSFLCSHYHVQFLVSWISSFNSMLVQLF